LESNGQSLFTDSINITVDGSPLISEYNYVKINDLKATLNVYAEALIDVSELVISASVSPVEAGYDVIKINTNISHWNSTSDSLEVYVGGTLINTLALNPSLTNNEWVIGPVAPTSNISFVYKSPTSGANIGLNIWSALSGIIYTANQPPATEGEILLYTVPAYTPSTTMKFIKGLTNKLYVGPNGKLVMK